MKIHVCWIDMQRKTTKSEQAIGKPIVILNFFIQMKQIKRNKKEYFSISLDFPTVCLPDILQVICVSRDF